MKKVMTQTTTAAELAALARTRARICLATHGTALAAQADADADLIARATDLVRSTDFFVPHTERTIELMALALLTAAYTEATQR